MMLIHRLRTRSSERYVKTTWCSPGEIGIARSEWYALRISTGVPSISAFHAGNQLSAITSSAGSSVETSRLSRFVVRSIQETSPVTGLPMRSIGAGSLSTTSSSGSNKSESMYGIASLSVLITELPTRRARGRPGSEKIVSKGLPSCNWS